MVAPYSATRSISLGGLFIFGGGWVAFQCAANLIGFMDTGVITLPIRGSQVSYAIEPVAATVFVVITALFGLLGAFTVVFRVTDLIWRGSIVDAKAQSEFEMRLAQDGKEQARAAGHPENSQQVQPQADASDDAANKDIDALARQLRSTR